MTETTDCAGCGHSRYDHYYAYRSMRLNACWSCTCALYLTPRDACLQTLRHRSRDGDPEVDHRMADDALLTYINDPEITEAFHAIRKWYA